MPLDGQAKPFPKVQQLARGERRYRRKVASAKRWQQIADAKQGVCRVCGAPPPNQLHHVLSRGQGGADTESNIVPLCMVCHNRVTVRDQTAVRALLSALTDAEYAYAIEHGGEGVFEAHYRLVYTRA